MPYDAPDPVKPSALKLTQEEIVSAVEAEEAFCIDGKTGQLAIERTEALNRYRGLPLGNEIEGRSQVVDKSVLDTIEWIMPSLIRIYLGGDGIGQFEARGPDDEEAAKTETDVVNWYLETKNDLFSQINATLRDALLLKNGYMVAYWSKDYNTMVETYEGMSDEEAAMLMQDAEVTVLEHAEKPDEYAQAMMAAHMAMQAQQGQPSQPMPQPMLHDLKIERKSCDEYVQVESVPPDEMLVSRRHRWTSLKDVDFVQWRRRVTIGQLRAEGFEVSDEEPQDEEFTQEQAIRDRYSERNSEHDDTPDPARRVVTFKDTYMRIDLRDKGTTQLWRICIISGQTEPILLEEADIVPFPAFSPIVYPHSHIGSSVFDLINELSLIKTTLLRQFLDGVYLANSGRTAVDQDRVNLDDLLIMRPGGIVRVDGDPSTAMVPIVSADVTQSVLSGLTYIDELKEQRTGVSRNTAGLDPNTLNRTATGVQMVQSAANQRIELIARTLAGGFRDLYLIVHALALKHSTKPLQLKLNNKWVQVNPREWTRRTDFTVSVGLGVGTPDAQLAKLSGLAPLMQQAQAMGLAGPVEMHNYGTEIWKAAGYKNAQRFLAAPEMEPETDPQTGQPNPKAGKPKMPPQPPNPLVQVEQMKLQASQQTAQQKMQADQQGRQMDMQIAQQKIQMETQAKSQQQMAELQLQKSNDERQAQLDQQKFQLEMVKIDREQESRERTEIKKAEIQAATALEVARINRGLDDGIKATQEMLQQAGLDSSAAVSAIHGAMQTMATTVQDFAAQRQAHEQAMKEHAQAVSRPKTIVRHPVTGRAIGLVPTDTRH